MSLRPLLAGVVLFIFALGWNALVHLVVLANVNASVRHLHRADFGDKAWLSLVLTAGLIALFLAGYRRFARGGSRREAVTYGVWFAAVAGLLVDLNQYVLYPLPVHVVGLWGASGFIEFTVYGLLAQWLWPPVRHAPAPCRSD